MFKEYNGDTRLSTFIYGDLFDFTCDFNSFVFNGYPTPKFRTDRTFERFKHTGVLFLCENDLRLLSSKVRLKIETK